MIYALVVLNVVTMVLLVALLVRLVDTHRSHVDSLLQRIQAPEQAVYMHETLNNALPLVQPLPFDDDDAFHQLSKEQLAASLVE